MTTFGLQLPNFNFPGVSDDGMFEHVAGLAGAAEESGFDSVMVMDHFWQLPPLGGPDQPILEAYTLLGALAARTERVKLGTLVTGVTYRNPALLAKLVTTLDVISRGRAFLGIGAAWYEEEHDAFGFDFPSVGGRMQRLEEAVQACRAMFTEDAPTFNGKHYRIEGAKNLPRPIQPGGPPIMVGGSGEKRTLRIVARYADMCNLHGSPETIRRRLDILRKHCQDVGRDPSEVTTTRRGSLMLSATAEEAEQTSKMIRDAAGPEFDEQFTVGTEDQIVEAVGALVDAGLDCLIFDMAYGTADQVRQMGKRLVSEFA
ncbi:MAG: LLM class F420-dependent oxidoreductase [Actinobacteria bacterium]|nr:LLM class F420-dependent oxidoreductase [Actinomycetota bacterium]